MLKAKKWLVLFLAFSLLVMSILAGAAYYIDPYFQYRVKDHTYYLNSRYINAGLIKNGDYDTLIVGSCLIGNYQPEQFRQTMQLNPIKAESGAMSPKAIAAYLNYAAKIGKASQYFVNIDLSTFQTKYGDVINPSLMEDDVLSKGRYLLGYEIWFRFIPVDCGLLLYKSLYTEFPAGKLTQRTSIDNNGGWDDVFGKEIVLKNRETGQFKVSEVELDGLYERMTKNVDLFISEIDFESGSFGFVFPPYSLLFWCDAQDLGYFDTFLAVKHYFVQKLLEKGCTVYDYQAADVAGDLDYYSDSTHFSPTINAWMVDGFVSGEYVVTHENYAVFQNGLIENVNRFRDENIEFFSMS